MIIAGTISMGLADPGHVYGLDFCRETLKRLKSVRPMLKLRIGDVGSLPYDKNVFGGVLHFGVAEHLKKGTRVCITEQRYGEFVLFVAKKKQLCEFML